MFVGHGLVALAVVTACAVRLGHGRRRAVVLGTLAAGFATIPDVDVLYPLLATLAGPVSVTDAPATFWALTAGIHRGATHSLPVAAGVVLGVTVLARGAERRASGSRETGADGRRWRRQVLAGSRGWTLAGGFAIASLVAVVAVASGPLVAATVAAMCVAALGLAVLGRRAGVGWRSLGAVALVGLASHPFGDLLTGEPPPLLYPFDVRLLDARITLHGDPTMHLLGAFLLELATVWIAVAVLAGIWGARPWRQVRPRALAGVGVGLALLAIPPPTLDAATGFVAGVIAVGAVGAPVRRDRLHTVPWETVTTALAAVTLAVLAYGVGYALV